MKIGTIKLSPNIVPYGTRWKYLHRFGLDVFPDYFECVAIPEGPEHDMYDCMIVGFSLFDSRKGR